MGRTHGRAKAEIGPREHTPEPATRVASIVGDRLSEILDEPEKQRRRPVRPYGTGERRGTYSSQAALRPEDMTWSL